MEDESLIQELHCSDSTDVSVYIKNDNYMVKKKVKKDPSV